MAYYFRSLALVVVIALSTAGICSAQVTEVVYLSGTDKDHTVDWEFFATGGRNSGKWTTIPVPSNWELQGFGTYNYGHADPRSDEQGRYRYRFDVPAAWRGKNVQIVFGGSMTDTDVKINGKSAGPTHQGGFYEFRYDVTGLLRYGRSNLLEVNVSKESSNYSVNESERQADYWIFGGIYRPVSLEARPAEHIQRTALDADADGSFLIDVFLGGIENADAVAARIQTLDGSPVGSPFSATVSSGQEKVTLTTEVDNPKTWTAEFPNRYQVVVTLTDGDREVHRITEKFGFRTVELRPRDGIYVNGVRVHLKGVNRHSFWPDAGRTTSREISEMDVNLIKDMNMNAVRMSHYPPDRHFLEVTDSLGLFVLDELGGWQDAYDTEVGEELVRELVIRDVNHPSVIFWNSGNEGGFNYELDDDFALYDPQKRFVIHPWAYEEGAINTVHYRTYDCCAGRFFNGRDLFMPTEFLHGLYDGGHGAALNDMWNRMLQNPLAAGAFLWALADEGIVRHDLDGMIDVDGNHAPDGIVGPYREKEGSVFTVKRIWSPVHIEQAFLPPGFDGRLRLQNRYYFTNLDQVTFEWRLAKFPAPGEGAKGHEVVHRGRPASPSAAPWTNAVLDLNLPADWREADALYLTATDPHGREIYTWSWMTGAPATVQEAVVHPGTDQVTALEDGNTLTLRSGDTEVRFDRTTGMLVAVTSGGQAISLANGPRLIGGESSLTELKHYADGPDHVVEATYEGNLERVVWRMLPGGWLRLDYGYEMRGSHDYLGVSFDYPEDRVRNLTWLGRGPYRVWRNRMQGMEFDVWHKAYNDTKTGASWDYPEFKGNHAELYWAVFGTTEKPITVVSATEDLFLRVFTPTNGVDPRYSGVEFPEGDISFLHAIAPIGTGSNTAPDLGPEGGKNQAVRDVLLQEMGIYEGTLFFYFGTPPAPATH